MKKKKKIIIISVIIIVLAMLLLGRCGNSANQNQVVMVNVKTEEAVKETLVTKALADGSVKAREEQDIKVPLTGTVKEVFVKSGDFVKEGTPLYSIEDRNIRYSLETVLTGYEEAKVNYENLLDTYRNQDRISRLRLEEARKNLEIALLSYQQDLSSLEAEELRLVQELEEMATALKKAEEELNDNKYLYEKNAIAKNTLEASRERFEELERNYKRLENNLNIFLEQRKPNTLELASLKIDNARNNLEYLEATLEKEKITEKDLEVAKLKLANMETEIEKLQKDLEMAVVKAPMTGTIMNLGIKKGDRIVEGETIGSIANLDSYIVEVMVDEIDVNAVAVGQDVIITSDAFSAELEGVVTFIAPGGTNVGNINKYRTEIDIIDAKGLLRPGMFVNVEIITNRLEDVIAVPSLAILGDDEKFVFVVEEGMARKRPVEVGMRSLSKVEIRGVEAGEKVIIGPYSTLITLDDGKPVFEMGE